MESFLFSYQDSLLLSGVVVVLLFALIQAYVHPFKNTIINGLDLIFMGIFIALANATLYLYPNTSGHEESTAVNVCGGVAFFLFCLIIMFHLHNALGKYTVYSKCTESLKTKFNIKGIMTNWNPSYSVNDAARSMNHVPDVNSVNDSLNYIHLQESLLEEN